MLTFLITSVSWTLMVELSSSLILEITMKGSDFLYMDKQQINMLHRRYSIDIYRTRRSPFYLDELQIDGNNDRNRNGKEREQ